jgi:hypothetical protein
LKDTSSENTIEAGTTVTTTTQPSPNSDLIQLNDKRVRLLFAPALGIFLAAISGLYHGLDLAQPIFWISSGYFILVSAVIWQGNRFLWNRLRGKPDWLEHPVRRVLLLGITSLPYTVVTCAFMLLVWEWIAGFGRPDWSLIKTSTLATALSVGIIVHAYETVYLIRQRRRDRADCEKLERARARAELAMLAAQVDPHFVFNSLNTLVELTEEDPACATKFTLTLAEVYRYIVSHRSGDLVPVADEVGFLKKYYSLLSLRFGEGLRLDLPAVSPYLQQRLLPPASLQLLLENTVKHNQFSPDLPLHAGVEVHEHEIVFWNERHRKQTCTRGAQTGLKNLNERSRLASGRGIEVLDDGARFVVIVPLV